MKATKALQKAVSDLQKGLVKSRLLEQFNVADSLEEKSDIIDALEYLEDLDNQEEIAILGRLARCSAN